MFVQIIEGTASDAEGLSRQGERWQQELRPGATGFLGVTSGVAAGGRAITIVRFESEAAARAQSNRPEQGAWWSETEKCYAGPVTFAESSDVTEFLGAGSDDAGFVQVMKVSDVPREKVEQLDAEFEKVAARLRPDLLGGIRAWTSPTTYVETMYFTSEADARAAEKAGPPEELQALMGDFGELMSNTEFIDLPNPQLH